MARDSVGRPWLISFHQRPIADVYRRGWLRLIQNVKHVMLPVWVAHLLVGTKLGTTEKAQKKRYPSRQRKGCNGIEQKGLGWCREGGSNPHGPKAGGF